MPPVATDNCSSSIRAAEWGPALAQTQVWSLLGHWQAVDTGKDTAYIQFPVSSAEERNQNSYLHLFPDSWLCVLGGLCEPQSSSQCQWRMLQGEARTRTGEVEGCSVAGLGAWGLAVVWGCLAFTTKPSSYRGFVTWGSPLCSHVEAVCGQSQGKPKSERKMTKGEREKNTEDRVGQSVPGK